MASFDFTDLILLVGTNPLPNYVVAKYFLGEKEKGNCGVERIWLVCSSDTQEIAENRIKPALQRVNSSISIKKLPLQSDYKPKIINNDLQNFLKELKSKGRKFHLNYTGGTKSMSVHSHKDFRDLDKKESRFSYLHAKSYTLIDDEDNVLYADLRKVVSIGFKELCELHGVDFTPTIENKIDKLESIEFLDAIKFIETKIEAGKINEILEETSRKALLSSLCIHTDPKKINNFLNAGNWLEPYISYLLLKSNLISTVYQNIKPKIQGVEFEIDNCFFNGYQFIGISCGVSPDKTTMKLKGFEILSRIRQLSGDEADTILIAPGIINTPKSSDLTLLKKELNFETGGGIGNIIVIDREDLKLAKFQSKIQDILK